jgi:hypothetical protein
VDTPDIPPPTHRETPPVSPAPGTDSPFTAGELARGWLEWVLVEIATILKRDRHQQTLVKAEGPRQLNGLGDNPK